MDNIGNVDLFVWYGLRWVVVVIVLFCVFKIYIFEGGICCFCVIWYLKFKCISEGKILYEFIICMDILFMMLDFVGVMYFVFLFYGWEIMLMCGCLWVLYFGCSFDIVYLED